MNLFAASAHAPWGISLRRIKHRSQPNPRQTITTKRKDESSLARRRTQSNHRYLARSRPHLKALGLRLLPGAVTATTGSVEGCHNLQKPLFLSIETPFAGCQKNPCARIAMGNFARRRIEWRPARDRIDRAISAAMQFESAKRTLAPFPEEGVAEAASRPQASARENPGRATKAGSASARLARGTRLAPWCH